MSMASVDTGNVKRLVAKFDTGGTLMKDKVKVMSGQKDLRTFKLCEERT